MRHGLLKRTAFTDPGPSSWRALGVAGWVLKDTVSFLFFNFAEDHHHKDRPILFQLPLGARQLPPDTPNLRATAMSASMWC